MKTFSILTSTSPRSAQWQLAGFVGAPTSMLWGWHQAPRAVDNGMPDEVANVLSRALCRCARISFLFSAPEEITATYQKEFYSIQPIREPGPFAPPIVRWWSGSPPRLVIVSSSDPNVVFRLFNDGYFSWVLQGQTAFLSSLSDPVPDFRDVLSKAWQNKYQDAPLDAINDYSLMGIMRPGVDGDVAGILFRSIQDRGNFLTALQEEAESSSMQFKHCDEAEFMDSLANSASS